MRTVNLQMQIQKTIHRLNSMGGSMLSNIQLLISSDISCFRWNDDSLELLIRKFLIHALSVCDSRDRIQLEVCQRPQMKGLETFLSLVADRWFACSFAFQAHPRFEESAKSVMENLGYRCMEWIGNNNSGDQMGVYCRDGKQRPELVLYLLHRQSHIQCDLLIPIFEPAGDPAEVGGNVAQFRSLKKRNICV